MSYYLFHYYAPRRYFWFDPGYVMLIVAGIIDDARDFFLDLAATRSTVPPWGGLLAIEARARAIDK